MEIAKPETQVFSPAQCGFPSRPLIKSKKGIKKVKAVSNMYSLDLVSRKSRKSLKILSWSVRLLPEMNALDSRYLYKKVMTCFKRQIREKIGFFILTGQIIYTIENPDVDYRKTGKILLEDESKKEKDEEAIALELTLNKNVYDLTNMNVDPTKNLEIIKFLNLIVKAQFLRMNMYELGYNKKYYLKDMTKSLDIYPWKYNLLIGFSSSVGFYEGGLMMNLDYNCRILRGYTLWEEIQWEFENQKGDRKSIREIADEVTCGKSFVLTYANDRIVRMQGIAEKMSIKDAFPNKKFKNYAEYYLKVYGCRLKDPDQFIVYSISKNYKVDPSTDENLKRDRKGFYREEMIHFPSELLLPTGLKNETFNQRNFKDRGDNENMKKITENTKLSPEKRIMKGEEFADRFNDVAGKLGSDIQERKRLDLGNDVRLKINKKSNEVDALLLDRPSIMSGDGRIKVNPSNGTYNMRNKVVDKNCMFDNWVIFYDSFQERNIKFVIENLRKASKSYGIRVKNPIFQEKIPNRNVDPDELIEMIEAENSDITLALFLVGDRNRIYEMVKYAFAKKGTISTQFFVSNYKYKNLSVVSKVLLQSVAKQGCRLWTVENGFKSQNHDNMLIGIDVINAGRSMGVSMVGTTNRGFDEQVSMFDKVELTKKRATRESLAMKIAEMAKELVREFYNENKTMPENIIFYRIGAGNSSGLQMDLKFEAQNIKAQIKSLGKGDVKMAYFGVAKKINERIFQSSGGGRRGGTRISNPSGGLIVCEGMTKRNLFEFYMVAQYVNQGSATPTHYFCIVNDTSLHLEEILKTTYFQTFNYKNWQGPIRIPAVAMNAERQSKLWAEILKFRGIKTNDVRVKNYFTYYL